MFVGLSALAGLAAGTLVSEDLTSIGAGLLVRDGQVTALAAAAACSAGVYLGDLALWLAGRVLGRRVLALPWIAGRVDAAMIDRFGARLDERLGAAVLASRFLPGSRLPMFLAAGIAGRRPLAFAAWSLLAVLVWTPTLVLLTAWCGPSLTNPLVGGLGYAFRVAVTAALLLLPVRLAVRWATVGRL